MAFEKGKKPRGRRIKTVKGELIEEAFAAQFVRNGMNGLQAYKAIRPTTSDANAGVQSSRMLKSPSVLDKVRALLPSDTADLAVIRDAYNAPREETIKWSDLQRFVRLSLELKGYLGAEKDKTQTNIALVVES